VLGWGLARMTTAAPATTAQPRSVIRREATRATDSGPRNSSVTASPSPIVSMARYSERFIVAKISASATMGRHCAAVSEASLGRTEASSSAAATHCRTATTPTGPSTGKASAAVAAPA